MKVLNRLLTNIKKKTNQLNDQQDIMTSNSSTSTISPTTKKFSSLCWRKKKNPTSTDEKPEQQQLLTQCIEIALFRDPLPPNHNKRWSLIDVRPSRLTFEQEPIKPARTRKISLPPQLSNIGYLASIPEVDSQVTLDFNSSKG